MNTGELAAPPCHPVTVTYTNYRGETGVRRIKPRRMWFGSTEFHPEPQWLLDGFDMDREADRTYAVRDIAACDASS